MSAESILEWLAKVAAVFFGSANDRELKRLWPIVGQVNDAWAKIRTMSDAEIRSLTDDLRRRLVAGATEDEVLPEAFAAVREASHRTLGEGNMIDAPYEQLTVVDGQNVYKPVEGQIPLFAHFDVQVLGGLVLHSGKIAEMVTGEGKTLVATLPSYLNALRPNDEWVMLAKQQWGENPAAWEFKPFGRFMDAPGQPPEWRPMDKLRPDPDNAEEAAVWKAPMEIVGVGRGVHVVTVNDYLAQRDADYTKPLYDFLGITVGAIQSGMDSRERYPIYRGDITYGTNSEFGFDYLRDNLKVRHADQVQAQRFFAIVDEVDSVLIDEARTPLIISGSTHQTSDKYYLADRIARKLEGKELALIDDRIATFMKQGYQREDARLKAEEDADFVYSERDHSAKLTERGMNRALRYLSAEGVTDIYSGENLDMPHYLDNALRAHSLYKKDHHYIVKDGQVYIVDEFTGRVLEGRRWSDGLHQAVEAKEHLKIKEESQTVATITYQNFFRLYEHLAGMTGTAMTEAKEFDRIYNLGVIAIPTNRPLRRLNYPDLVYGTLREKDHALIDHVAEVHATGQPVLVGTASIERSEMISEMLKKRGIPHEVLNAKNHAREAQIIMLAGQMGQVTVATNMAGRGTDIKLGTFTREELLEHWKNRGLVPRKAQVSADMADDAIYGALREHWVGHYLADAEEPFESLSAAAWDKRLAERWAEYGMEPPRLVTRVAEMGGLHIVGSERHEARRIDNQLRGRSGRQGDPGSSRFFLSLEDDMMRMFASESVKKAMQWLGLKDGQPIESKSVTKSVEKAQRKVEERNFELRKNLIEYDQVMNDQRKAVYGRRQQWVEDEGLRDSMLEYCTGALEAEVAKATEGPLSLWKYEDVGRFMRETFLADPETVDRAVAPPEGVEDTEERLGERMEACLVEAYDAKEKRISPEIMRILEKMLLIETLDRKWMDHLYAMDLLKEGIRLRSYGGQDPKIRYKIEGFQIFQEMWDGLQTEVSGLVMKLNPAPRMAVAEQVQVKEAVQEQFNAQADAADAVGADAEGKGGRRPIRAGRKVGPNEPCPCGSGKKYKKCCGR